MMLSKRKSAEELRQICPLPELMYRIGLGEHARKSARCPFHGDRHASFSLYDTPRGTQWKCHAGCGGGDEVDFLTRARGIDNGEAFSLWEKIAEGNPASFNPSPTTHASQISPPSRPTLPADFHFGSRTELETVARLRRVHFWAVATMQQNGVIGFGTVCGEPCWIVKDGAGRCAEARRMDGRPFPAFDGGSERKAHTLRGSSKSWPVGLGLGAERLRHFKRALLLEGSGDLAAGYHFAEPMGDWLPIAFLGAGVQNLHAEALELLAGKQIRIVSHVDSAGANARERLGSQLKKIPGCSVDWFDLEGLRKADGSQVKDLNDCTNLHPDDAAEMGGLLQ